MAPDDKDAPLLARNHPRLRLYDDGWLGSVVMIPSLPLTIWAGCSAALVIALVAFVVAGSYTKRTRVAGLLVPDMGLMKVYAPQTGTVLRSFVKEGQVVSKDTVLYEISSERHIAGAEKAQEAISAQAQTKVTSLESERSRTRHLQGLESDTLEDQLHGLREERARLQDVLREQTSRVDLAHATLDRYREIAAQGYLSKDQLLQKEESSLALRADLKRLERDYAALDQQISTTAWALRQLPLKHEKELATLDRSLAAARQELTESEAKRSVSVVAPADGVVAAVLVQVGQLVEPAKPLVTIVPKGARLEAHLYAPSAAIGFVKQDDPVLLRYEAFPYQKFGHYRGKVISIAHTAMSRSELSGDSGLATSLTGVPDPVYRITVELQRQSVDAYGSPQSLQAGMLVDADVLQETRQLYEWALEPLYSMTKRLAQ